MTLTSTLTSSTVIGKVTRLLMKWKRENYVQKLHSLFRYLNCESVRCWSVECEWIQSSGILLQKCIEVAHHEHEVIYSEYSVALYVLCALNNNNLRACQGNVSGALILYEM